MVEIERELTAVIRRLEREAGRVDRTVAERDELIREAIAVKLPRTRLREITGLSKQRLDQIRRGARL